MVAVNTSSLPSSSSAFRDDFPIGSRTSTLSEGSCEFLVVFDETEHNHGRQDSASGSIGAVYQIYSDESDEGGYSVNNVDKGESSDESTDSDDDEEEAAAIPAKQLRSGDDVESASDDSTNELISMVETLWGPKNGDTTIGTARQQPKTKEYPPGYQPYQDDGSIQTEDDDDESSSDSLSATTGDHGGDDGNAETDEDDENESLYGWIEDQVQIGHVQKRNDPGPTREASNINDNILAKASHSQEGTHSTRIVEHQSDAAAVDEEQLNARNNQHWTQLIQRGLQAFHKYREKERQEREAQAAIPKKDPYEVTKQLLKQQNPEVAFGNSSSHSHSSSSGVDSSIWSGLGIIQGHWPSTSSRSLQTRKVAFQDDNVTDSPCSNSRVSLGVRTVATEEGSISGDDDVNDKGEENTTSTTTATNFDKGGLSPLEWRALRKKYNRLRQLYAELMFEYERVNRRCQHQKERYGFLRQELVTTSRAIQRNAKHNKRLLQDRHELQQYIEEEQEYWVGAARFGPYRTTVEARWSEWEEARESLDAMNRELVRQEDQSNDLLAALGNVQRPKSTESHSRLRNQRETVALLEEQVAGLRWQISPTRTYHPSAPGL